MSTCGKAGKTRYIYTGNQVGDLNQVGDYNFVSGGPAGSGLSAGTTVGFFHPVTTERRIWERDNALMSDTLLDAAYPIINLQWFAEIRLDEDVIFRISDRSFYVQDEDGVNRYYDARADKGPTITVTVGEWLTPNYEVSDLTLSLNNRDGFFNQYLPHGDSYRQWSDASVVIKVGFGELRSNYFTLFEGQVSVKKGLTTTRDTIELLCYDKLDLDEVPIPPSAYSIDNYPDIGEDGAGRPVPIIYGDWTDEVPEWGAISATCINSGDDEAETYDFKVSYLELESLDSVWLHRGARKEDTPDGPIQFDIDELDISLDEGSFSVPVGTDVFATETILLDNQAAGTGSTTNLITAKDDTINFITQRIQEGDRVLKRSTGEYGIVTAITNAQLTLSGGIAWALDDEYVVLTNKYKFIKGDKISVVCKGKPLNVVSTTRIPDASTAITEPNGLSVSLDGTYWVCDDATQKIYNLSFGGDLISSVDYADIDAAIDSLSGISVGGDGFAWLTCPTNSTIYRYNLTDGSLGLSFSTLTVTGILAELDNISGIIMKTDNKFWIVDQTTSTFYEIDPFSDVAPFVVTTFGSSAFDGAATSITDVGYDEGEQQVVCVDSGTLKGYRVNKTTGALISSVDLTGIADNIASPSGCAVGQDGTLFFLDFGNLLVYNYNDASSVSTNPCWIARDILQQFGGHTYDQFDTSWNETARQMIDFKARAAIADKSNVITYINTLLRQFNAVFHLRFGKFSLFWITFANFRTNGRLVKEKDIKDNTFKPGKEINQYFNSATATYGKRPFQGKSLTSDTYVSPSGVAFAGKEVNKVLDSPNIYRRSELDHLLPLFVRLAVPEPEFVDVTFGFRVIRSQMQDFLSLTFDGDINCATGEKDSGRRFNEVPCMIRKMMYDLDAMNVSMHLWSLGNTRFPGYEPEGRTVGGDGDPIVLSSVGRIGRVSPVGHITAYDSTSVTLADFGAEDAESRTSDPAGLAWTPGYRVALMDGTTKEVLQVLTIDSVDGQVVTFVEEITATMDTTDTNGAGFVSGGVFLQYSTYSDMTEVQRTIYGSFSKPTSGYPTSKTRELEEQRAGVHNFPDGGIPYVLYPADFVSY